jgi:periplasmic protein TonB
MADRLLVDIEDRTFAERAAAQADDRRRRRRALAAAVVLHLLVLMAPRPRPDPGPPVDPGDPRLFLLTDVRFAPPEPPEPVVPELDAEVEDAAPGEEIVEEAAPPGPPPPPAVEVLFPEGDLSRLTPPRPLDAAPPEAPAEGGEVHLYLQLDENGQVYGVRGASGDAALLAAAERAAKGWVFLPATLDGQPIPVVVEVVVRFPRSRAAAAPPPR